MTSVIFLDIDGILLSGRAWLLLDNMRLQAEVREFGRPAVLERVRRDAVFDPVAVALVNRIASTTGAKVVLSSSWRYTVGAEATIQKLVAQGLRPDFLHADAACTPLARGAEDKRMEILGWIDVHPGVQDYLVIDDEPDLVPGRTLPVDALDGLGPREAAAAIRYLGGLDPRLGVGDVPRADWEAVVAAFNGDRVKASVWLEGAQPRSRRRHRPSAALRGPLRDALLREIGAFRQA